MFDIIVIGGNLAGASAAINAAKKGTNVALIERNTSPHNPAHCGEAMADTTQDLLDFTLDEIKCKYNKISKFQVNLSKIKRYKFKLRKNKIIIFDRNCVEKNLLKHAEKNGVKLFLGKKMTNYNPPYEIVINNNSKIKGKIIIDASGIACQIGRRIGINTKIKTNDLGICIQNRVKSLYESDTIKTWFHKPYAPFGYAWIFPLDENTANIGLGIPSNLKLDIDELLDSYIKDEIKSKKEITNTFKSCVPSARPLTNIIKNNVIFTGDAARLPSSAMGSGIHNALFSGSLAGRISASYINDEIKSLNIYQKEMNEKIKRLNKTYENKIKLNNDEKYIKGYKKAFKKLELANKIAPNLFQGYVSKLLRKDEEIINKY